MRILCTAVLTVLIAPAAALRAQELPTIEARTHGLQEKSGFLSFHVDGEQGKVFLRLPAASIDQDLIHVNSLRTGLGSNPVGLDRARLGETRVVRFQRIGRKVLLVQRNLAYRALGNDTAQQQAVRESFPESVLWGGAVEAASGRDVLVDVTSLLVSDLYGIAASLQRSGEGAYALDPARSTIDPARMQAFPRNIELEAILTFSAKRGGRELSSTAPDARSVTVRMHHSFVQSPPPGYRPRRFDARSGYFARRFRNYAAPLGEPMDVAYVIRHRLQKKQPGTAPSEAVEPIVYYVDPGIPEPVRSAVIEGAGWWQQAFEAAGFVNAFRVELLPAGADPLDVRYNVINWVHRATRGWSYGSSVVDPRTGEILKGHVLLGSLRVRQDQLLYSGLAPQHRTGGNGDGACCGAGGGPEARLLAALDLRTDATQVALARIRQLAAHEVGHTLGLAHNFAASRYGRASVMDYPAPLVKLDGKGGIDLSDAYAVGLGAWDRLAIRYGYSEFAADRESSGLVAIVKEGIQKKYQFLTDADARPVGAADPAAALWDNGDDAVKYLTHSMAVRRAALERLGETSIPVGAPAWTLEHVLVPLYLHHRYAVDACAKVLGGARTTYAHRGDGQVAAVLIPSGRQRAALRALLKTLDPIELQVPDSVLDLLGPPPPGHARSRESFVTRTAPLFDVVAAAQTASDLTLDHLLDPNRLARLVQQGARNASIPSADEVVETLINETFGVQSGTTDMKAALARVVERNVVGHLMRLADDPDAAPDVRAVARGGLTTILGRAGRFPRSRDPYEEPHMNAIVSSIKRFLERPYGERRSERRPRAPAGSPIGR